MKINRNFSVLMGNKDFEIGVKVLNDKITDDEFRKVIERIARINTDRCLNRCRGSSAVRYFWSIDELENGSL